MKIPYLLSVLLAVSVQAEETFQPETVVATVNGKKITAAELQAVVTALPPQAQQNIVRDPKGFLEQLGMMRRVSEIAEREKLDQQSPFREQLEFQRQVILYNAAATDAQNKLVVTADDVKAYYDKNADRYTQARLKVIYISFTTSETPLSDPNGKKVLSEAEAREKAEKLRKEILAGADFVKLAQLHSDDKVSLQKEAEYGTIRKGDKIPNEIRNTVFALKVGEVSEPVRLPNGFYLFRAEEIGRQPMEQLESALVTEIRQARFQEWLNSQKRAVQVTIENDAFFKPKAPAPRQTPPTLGPKGVK